MSKLYVFFGSSGIGKDYMQSEFIKFSKTYKSSDDSNKSVIPVKRLHSRKQRDNENDTNRYEVPKEEICSEENYYSEVNGDYIGISKKEVKEALLSGQNLVYSTGSIDMINKMLEDPELANSICLIYITAPGYSEADYIRLEYERKPDRDPDEILASAKKRYENSQRVDEFYNKNKEVFDYAYMNITKNANQEIVKQQMSVFFSAFFKELLEPKHIPGPNWISNSSKDKKIY